MRHHNSNRKFGLERKGRKALIRSLLVSLVVKERITTGEAKAKELRSHMEKLITLGKKQTPASRRLVISTIGVLPAKKLSTIIAPKYKDRMGGYTRVVKLPRRVSDGSSRAIIELV